MNAPANVPNLPALLEQLPDDDTRKPGLEFTPAVMREFCEALAVVGSVRSAARVARVSHQTVYRARRASPEFRRCWDAALLQALPHAEDALATRAIDGVEEKVFYHGEEIGTRRRHDPRLLLAHIGRLDRLAARADVAALSDCFDAALDALATGADLPEPPPCATAPAEPPRHRAPARGRSFSGQCNTRSMSNTGQGDAGQSDTGRSDANPCDTGTSETGMRSARQGVPDRFGGLACDCVGARYGTDEGAPHYRMGADGPEPVVNTEGEGPCCDRPRWPECRDCPHYPPLMRVLEGMDEDRPEDAPTVYELAAQLRAAHALASAPAGTGGAAQAPGVADAAADAALAEPLDADEIEALQMEAYEAGVPGWWTLTDEAALEAALDALEDEDEEEVVRTLQ